MDTLQDLVDRLETTYSCYHPVIADITLPSDSLWSLASAVLQIHNTTQDMSTKAMAATALKAIQGAT